MKICSSFIINPTTNARITNEFIKGKNNMCNVIRRIGFGFKSFDAFRVKVLYVNDEDRPYKSYII